MMNALKKNPALYIGLALPLLMLLFFAGVPFISSLVVEPPQYNFIYSVKSYQTEGTVRFVDGKLELDAYNRDSDPHEPPSVYLIDVHSKKYKKLDVNEEGTLIPPHQHRTFVLKGVLLKNLDTSTVSPDGYQYVLNNNDNIDLFSPFFRGSKMDSLFISKSGRIEKFQIPTDVYWNMKFEGWVIPAQ